MKNRIWDPEGKYKEGFLKEYTHWILEVSFRQHTLGCFIIFAKRKVKKISELHAEELQELPTVMRDIEIALISEFHPELFNYLQLGNILHHLHFHGIPRYSSERIFDGITWTDASWGAPPIWSEDDVSTELAARLKDTLLSRLP